MAFEPVRLADGRVCCSVEHALCASCTARQAERKLRGASSYDPPNPYGVTKPPPAVTYDARGIPLPYAAATPPPPPAITLDAHGIPDIYAAGLAKLRSEAR